MRRALGIFFILVAMAVLPIRNVSAEKPVVYIQPALTYENSINIINIDEDTRRQVERIIGERLKQMADAGDLPYEVRVATADSYHSTNEHIIDSDKIFLYPTIMVSTSIDTVNNNSLETAYTSTVIAGISLMFCMPEENLDITRVTDGGNPVSLRLLGIVPMVEAETIGLSRYNPSNDSWQNIHNTPISEWEKKGKFISLVRQMMKDDISFSNIKGNLRDDKAKLGMDTYQVTDVDMSSAMANELFTGKEAEDLKFLVGYCFTSAYQKKTKRVMYPPAVGGQDLVNSMINGAYKLSLDSANGKVDVHMSNPGHSIRLDISGLASEVVDSGNNVYTTLHKVWLTKSPVEGKEKRELSRLHERTVKLPPGTSTDSDDNQIYAALLLGLAQELGGQDK
ncbi:hypothetical protein [Anaerovibrio lipolyticus]|uniref:hypothetical protein n=1 Tax=Anaerovibrio lipolyticus TaxID=82374 RepID=UPI0025E1D43C|nr:hypothetical protein [Anaerovibrio lipolyticus]